MSKRKTYTLGNWLRGFCEGRFESEGEAWRWLSRRFLLSFPCKAGRLVSMYVTEVNPYGHEQRLICRKGELTWRGHLPKAQVLKRCKPAIFIG
jgi:hypothetical protein